MESVERTSLETLSGDPVHLLGVSITGELRGVLLDATVTQRFANPGSEAVELVYTFPLPWGAILLGVEVQLGDKRLTGAVVGEKEAETSYEEALADGDAAIMLERNHDRSYSLNLGNLAAGEKCTITLRYAQALHFEQGGLRLLIPTVLAPRYGHAQNDGGLQPHQVPEHGLAVQHPFTLELHLHDELARARIASPSHAIRVRQSHAGAETTCIVTLARKAFLDRDFILIMDELERPSLAIAGQVGGTPDRVAILASFCPRLAHQQPRPISAKILVDCSGSMGGDSIDAARRALMAIVGTLQDEDTFSLSRFGSTVEHRSRGLWKVCERTRLAAQRWVGDLQADLGGTEMQSALVSTFNLGGEVEGKAQADVLLVTDGEIYAIDDTLAAAQASGHRLFIVGIGSSPAEVHLRRLAEATGGACDFVAPGEAVEPAVLRMFARLRSPRMTDVQLQWSDGTQPAWMAPLPASVFDGDTVHGYALCEALPTGQAQLLGRFGSNAPLQVLGQVRLPEEADTTDAVARMAASCRIAVLAGRDSEEADEAARQLAMDYQLVTEYSNFLLVHERAEDEKADGMPRLVKVRQMMAAGWGGAGSVHAEAWEEIPAFSRVLSMRFALAEPGDTSLEEAGKAFDATREHIRQIDKKTLRKLQSRSRVEKLRSFSDVVEQQGLLPRDLCQWLAAHPHTQWPKTRADLQDLCVEGRNLSAAVQDWLESLIVQRGGSDQDEFVVVASFLYVMADARVWIDSASAEFGNFQAALDELARRAHEGEMEASRDELVDVSMVDKVVKVLRSTEGAKWPNELAITSSQE